MLLVSCHPVDQQSSPCYHIFLTVTLSYNSKVNLVGPLDVDKKVDAGFLYAFNIGFPTSPFLDLTILNSTIFLFNDTCIEQPLYSTTFLINDPWIQ